jgi:hypothetical protein
MVEVTRGADGSVLDVGRRTRTIPPALRRTLEIRDGGCRFPGYGLRFTDAHHVVHWGDGGETSLCNLVLLCRRHHQAVHEEGFRVRAKPDGTFRFFDRTGWPLPDRAPVASATIAGSRLTDRLSGSRRPVIRGMPTVSPSAPLPADPVDRLIDENRRRGVRPDALTPSATWKGEADIPWEREARVWEALDPA